MSKMAPRDRILAALSRRPTDIVPFDIGGIKTTSFNVAAYKNMEACLGMAEAPTQWGNYLSQRTHMTEAVSAYFEGDVRRVHIPHATPLPAEKLQRVQRDEWGIEWTMEPAGLFYVTGPALARAESIADLESFCWPNPAAIFHAPEALAKAAAALRQQTDCAICLDLPDTVVHVSQNIRGYEQWLVDSAVDTPFFEALLDHVTDIYVAMLAPVLTAVGDNIDLVVICDDIAAQNGPLISPGAYRSLIKPRHRRVLDAIRASSSAKIVFHSDGSMRWALGDLIDIGIDGFNPVQCSAANMAPADLKREFGADLCFWGAIDTHHVLPFGAPDEVREEVRRMIEIFASDHTGYVLGSVHIIQSEVPPQNVLAMAEAAHVYGGRSDGQKFRISCF